MTMKLIWATALLTVGSVVIVGAAGQSVRWVSHKHNSAELLWSNDEAYLFIKTSRVGWNRTYLTFLGDVLASITRFPTGAATDSRSDLVVVRMSRNGLERSEYSGVSVTSWKLVNDHVYTTVNGRTMRLDGTRFESALPDEDAAARNADISLEKDGWSWRPGVVSQLERERRFNLDVAGQRWTVIEHNHFDPEKWRAIDLQMGNDAPQRVLDLNERSRYVNKDEYQAFLRDR